jgi:hypothetical protein
MMNGINDELILAARLLLTTLFLIFGWRKLTDFPGTVNQMAQLGVPTRSHPEQRPARSAASPILIATRTADSLALPHIAGLAGRTVITTLTPSRHRPWLSPRTDARSCGCRRPRNNSRSTYRHAAGFAVDARSHS